MTSAAGSSARAASRRGRGYVHYSPRLADSPKHQKDHPSPRTSPLRRRVAIDPLPVESLDRICELLYPAPGSGLERLHETTRIAKALEYVPIPAELRGTLAALQANPDTGNPQQAVQTHRSYLDVGEACQRTRRTAVNHVARLEGFDCVETERRKGSRRRLNLRNAFWFKVPDAVRAQVEAHRAQRPLPPRPAFAAPAPAPAQAPSASPPTAPLAPLAPLPQRPQRPHAGGAVVITPRTKAPRPSTSSTSSTSSPAPASPDERAELLAALVDLEQRGHLGGFATEDEIAYVLAEAGAHKKSAAAAVLLIRAITKKRAAPAARRGHPLRDERVRDLIAAWMPDQKEPHEIARGGGEQPAAPPVSREDYIREALAEEERKEREEAEALALLRQLEQAPSGPRTAPAAIVRPMPPVAPPPPPRRLAPSFASPFASSAITSPRSPSKRRPDPSRFLVTNVSESAWTRDPSEPRGPPEDDD